MCPIYAVLAAPLARPLGVKVLLWYTHWNASRTLRAAERVSNTVLSVDRRTFPLDSPKVRAIGHGIDLSEFSCADGAPHADLRALVLGRYSRAKGLDVVLRGLRLALDDGLDARLEAVRAGAEPRRARVPRRARAAGRGARSRQAREARPRRAARRGAGAVRPRRRARQQHARRRDGQGRLRGVRGVRAGARVEPGVRHAAARRAPVRPRGPARPRRPAARPRRPRGPPRARPELRERVAESHSVDHWAARSWRRQHERGRSRVRDSEQRSWSSRGAHERARTSKRRPTSRSSTSRRSPASPARRRTCCRCSRGCASAAGTSGC